MPVYKSNELVEKLDAMDISGCLYLNGFCRQHAVKRFFAMISRLGDGVFWYSIACVLPLLSQSRGMEVSLRMLLTGLVCVLLYKQLKNRLVRERPFIRSKEIVKGCAPLDRYSFPSGHTMHAFAFSTVVLYFFPFYAWVLVPFTLLVALSRMVLGLHYPSDVICGAVLGLLIGCASNMVTIG